MNNVVQFPIKVTITATTDLYKKREHLHAKINEFVDLYDKWVEHYPLMADVLLRSYDLMVDQWLALYIKPNDNNG